MKISELAAATGTPVDTIRYYEREGLLPPPARAGNNYRHYDAAHAERLMLIRQARGLDMSLQEIRTLLAWRDRPDADCGAVNALLDEHIGHIATRIRELRALERQLKALRAQCRQASDTAHCGILSGLAQPGAAPAPVPPAPRHVQGCTGAADAAPAASARRTAAAPPHGEGRGGANPGPGGSGAAPIPTFRQRGRRTNPNCQIRHRNSGCQLNFA
ncbi:Cd(II)/Pb(II)-responsive transcriptional regulator [Ottowia testudinis]|uniref:Cd(II)/Pb(II)-responsive transcriptional regulator n=1 Tax=Ottowia testudinis TaxID=2816950 RepID=A0A975H4U3_9BURK|nr:Cd(II)/Pb(II)-responsive transcriptional regulator [Ottowia testudinis]